MLYTFCFIYPRTQWIDNAQNFVQKVAIFFFASRFQIEVEFYNFFLQKFGRLNFCTKFYFKFKLRFGTQVGLYCEYKYKTCKNNINLKKMNYHKIL